MDIEEFLKSAEGKKAIKDAVDAQVEAAVEEATKGLQAKNTELLGKVKKLQKDATIDPADHAALQEELAETQTKLTDAEKKLKTALTEAEKHKKAFENEAKVAHNLLVDNGLSAALIENGVKNPTYLEAAMALLKGQVVLEADGDKRVAKVGDKPLADFVKEWAGTDKGKAFVDAALNKGGGANGGGGGADHKGYEKITDPNARLRAMADDGVTE